MSEQNLWSVAFPTLDDHGWDLYSAYVMTIAGPVLDRTDFEALRFERLRPQLSAYLRGRQAVRSVDVEELEDHLRGLVATLMDSGLSAQTSYYYRVRSVTATGESDFSNIASATTGAPCPVGTAQSVTVAEGGMIAVTLSR